MARARQVKARKDYPQFGIKKGDVHWTWDLMLGPRSSKTFRQLEKPRRSQLTASEYLSTLYDIEDDLLEFDGSSDDVGELITRLEELRDETQDKFDNMPEGLQQGDTGQLLEERVNALDSAIQELEDAKSTLEEAESTLDDLTEVDAPEEPNGEDFDSQDEYADAVREFEDAQEKFDEYTSAKNDAESDIESAREAVQNVSIG